MNFLLQRRILRTLQPGEEWQLTIAFRPNQEAESLGGAVIISEDGQHRVGIMLKGTGVASENSQDGSEDENDEGDQ